MKGNLYFQKDRVLIEESVDRFLHYGGKWSKIHLRKRCGMKIAFYSNYLK
jgi:hypothetical protein